MKSGGGSLSHLGVYVGGDWYTHLSTYDDHTPILDISAGAVMVALGIAGRQVDTAAVEFARELASQTARFAAEVARLHARQSDGDGEGTGNEAGAGAGEAA